MKRSRIAKYIRRVFIAGVVLGLAQTAGASANDHLEGEVDEFLTIIHQQAQNSVASGWSWESIDGPEWGPAEGGDEVVTPEAEDYIQLTRKQYDAINEELFGGITPQTITISCQGKWQFYQLRYKVAFDNTVLTRCFTNIGEWTNGSISPSGGITGVCPGTNRGQIQTSAGGASSTVWSTLRGPESALKCYTVGTTTQSILHKVKLTQSTCPPGVSCPI